ncbi:single-stranded DNA-binding protein [Sporolactobacillus laevolacticus]|uniref:Single-stranded DNA-binding protein n=1 Tax=Sporolactobacillus laevolacticus DSM 442 TaxID=1395513 RepID=V6IZ27_9BACL|nr:single-stranded DNA-binding protein [Sporolactobacillus laevolacticus]EST12066.1 single-stranded DNA-binding protein [Sporolactobacillus laevolacticus DSM 442]
MINRVVLIGRLTKDPELKYTPNGVAVTSFTIAVNRPFSNHQGEREADFVPVVIWRRQAENAANFLHKGSLAGVEGRIQTRSYENNEGKRVYVTEVVADSVQFLEPKGAPSDGQLASRDNYSSGSQSASRSQSKSTQPSFEDPFAGDSKPIDIAEDDLPF